MSWGVRLTRLMVRAEPLVDTRRTIWVMALAAALLRLPGLAYPLWPDEAGFLLVARSWDPQPDSVYGTYWVDRPPLVIAVFKAADLVGGPSLIRVVGALAVGLFVLTAAAVARLVAGELAARWTAVAMAALTTSAIIDGITAKGEVLALPLLMGAIWLAVLAARRPSASFAAGAGLLAVLALCLKQNLVGGLVFGAVLLVAEWRGGRLSGQQVLRLGSAAAAGAAVPIVATVIWALVAGVRLPTLWYAVYGFRSDAVEVIFAGGSQEPAIRGAILVATAVGSGLLLIIGGLLVHVRGEWADDRSLTAATLAVLFVDVASLVVSGSYWRDYLFPLLPPTALCVALLARRSTREGVAIRRVVTATAGITALSLLGWAGWVAVGLQEFDEADTGSAIARSAAPGDTLTVFGGRADLQLTSGLDSPYEHLWSLPMRTLDPDYRELRALVGGPGAPTWLVQWVSFDSWEAPGGAALRDAVEEKYVATGSTCGDDHVVYVLRDVERDPPTPTCH